MEYCNFKILVKIDFEDPTIRPTEVFGNKNLFINYCGNKYEVPVLNSPKSLLVIEDSVKINKKKNILSENENA